MQPIRRRDERGEALLASFPLPWVNDRRTQVRLTIGAAMVALNLLDLLLTKWVIASGGVETNPFMVDLVGDTTSPWLVKACVPALAAAVLLLTPVHSRRGERLSACVVGVYSAIVVWNTVLLAYMWWA
ncbi:MAG: DUF5658 family protein [Actinomycetes bacterium]